MVVEIKKFKKEETAVVTSIDVAETFGKEHKNVLKDIRELDCSEECAITFSTARKRRTIRSRGSTACS